MGCVYSAPKTKGDTLAAEVPVHATPPPPVKASFRSSFASARPQTPNGVHSMQPSTTHPSATPSGSEQTPSSATQQAASREQTQPSAQAEPQQPDGMPEAQHAPSAQLLNTQAMVAQASALPQPGERLQASLSEQPMTVLQRADTQQLLQLWDHDLELGLASLEVSLQLLQLHARRRSALCASPSSESGTPVFLSSRSATPQEMAASMRRLDLEKGGRGDRGREDSREDLLDRGLSLPVPSTPPGAGSRRHHPSASEGGMTELMEGDGAVSGPQQGNAMASAGRPPLPPYMPPSAAGPSTRTGSPSRLSRNRMRARDEGDSFTTGGMGRDDSAADAQGMRVSRLPLEPDQAVAPRDPLLSEAAKVAGAGATWHAHALLQRLCRRYGCSYAALEQQAGEGGTELGIDPGRIKRDAENIRKALRSLDDDEGWMVSRNDDLKVLYRHTKGTRIHSVKFQAVFDAPIEHLLALAREFDLTSTWNKFVLDSTILAEPSIFESFVYACAWMPFPFPHMDSVIHACGHDLAEEERCLLILVNDPVDGLLPPNAAAIPAASAKRKRASIEQGSCIKLEPLPPGPGGQPRVRGSMVAHADPHMPHIPAFVINFVLKVMSPFIYNIMKKILRNVFADPSMALPQRIQNKPELYGLVHDRVQQYIHLAAEPQWQGIPRSSSGLEVT